MSIAHTYRQPATEHEQDHAVAYCTTCREYVHGDEDSGQRDACPGDPLAAAITVIEEMSMSGFVRAVMYGDEPAAMAAVIAAAKRVPVLLEACNAVLDANDAMPDDGPPMWDGAITLCRKAAQEATT